MRALPASGRRATNAPRCNILTYASRQGRVDTMLKAIGFALFVATSFAQGPVTPPANAPQGTATVSGSVSRVDNDKPVPNALVQLQKLPASRDNAPLLSRADASGEFRFEKLPAGSYSLIVTAD